LRTGPQMQIGWPGRRRRRHSAVRMAGRLQIELARRRAIEQPGLQDAVINNFEHAAGDPFGVERPRTQAAPPQRIVDDIDAGREYLSAALLAQEAALAGDRAAVGGAGKMADQGAGDTPVEHHRDAARRHLAWIEALDGPLSGASP